MPKRDDPRITKTRPKVATNSARIGARPVRPFVAIEKIGFWNMRCAAATPANAPAT